MDPVLIGIAFVLGFAARQVGQPPLVGFLVAGFVAHACGMQGGGALDAVADLGVTLLLFMIGLELDPRRLLKFEIWATASGHAVLSTGLFASAAMAAGAVGLSALAGLSWEGALALGFALSFSSTVFAVKNLDDRGEHSAMHGRSAIGILVLQDLFAVIFLTFASGKLPEIWAVALVGVILLRVPLLAILARVGHGELVILFGLFVALGVGAGGFGVAGLKPDLGALVLGAVLAGHPRAKELAHSLFPLKDLLLVGFFLQIGLSGLPTWEHLAIAWFLVACVTIKIVLFFLAFAQLRFRARSSVLAALALGSYSEFGLIVCAVAAQAGWLAPHWPGVVAVAVAGSFILVAPFQNAAHALNPHRHRWLARFERRRRHREEQPILLTDARIAVLGMGRVGTGAYADLVAHCGDVVVGVEVDSAKVTAARELGHRVIQADVTDPAFWHRLERGRIELILLAMPAYDSNIHAYELLRASNYEGKVAAIARFPDEVAVLQEAGVDVAFNMYAEAGAGFASHVRSNLEDVIPVASPNS
jgi:predicted Kef-type K+ transport protein